MSLARAAGGSSLLRRLAALPALETRRTVASASAAAGSTMPLSTQQPRPRQRQQQHHYQQTSLFHTSAPRPARRRRRFSNVRAAEMGLVDDEAVSQFTQKHFAGYSAEDKAALRGRYTAAQLAAVEAGEAAIDPRDLTVQGRLRTDVYNSQINYLDDFSRLHPVIDKRANTVTTTTSFDEAALAEAAEADRTQHHDSAVMDARLMDPDAFADDFIRFLASFVPKDVNLEGLSDDQLRDVAARYGPQDVDWMRWWFDRPAMVRRDGQPLVAEAAAGRRALVTDGDDAANVDADAGANLMDVWGDWAQAQSLGKQISGVSGRFKKQQDPEDDGRDSAGDYRMIKRQTGLGVQNMTEMATKVLAVRFVHNQSRLGKIRRTSVVAIAGNGNGWLGLGMGKSTEFLTAAVAARSRAIRNMQPIRRYENRTIYGNVQGKVSGTVVQLQSRPPGFGLRVPSRIFEIARAAGIDDLAAKIPRSRNPMNVVKATFEALMNQKDPEDIAIGRGKKMVDVRKVYYGGAVY